jgi:hypothetical protein
VKLICRIHLTESKIVLLQHTINIKVLLTYLAFFFFFFSCFDLKCGVYRTLPVHFSSSSYILTAQETPVSDACRIGQHKASSPLKVDNIQFIVTLWVSTETLRQLQKSA